MSYKTFNAAQNTPTNAAADDKSKIKPVDGQPTTPAVKEPANEPVVKS